MNIRIFPLRNGERDVTVWGVALDGERVGYFRDKKIALFWAGTMLDRAGRDEDSVEITVTTQPTCVGELDPKDAAIVRDLFRHWKPA